MTDKKIMTEDEAIALIKVDNPKGEFRDLYKGVATFIAETQAYSATGWYGRSTADDAYYLRFNADTRFVFLEEIEDEQPMKIVRKSDGAVFEIEREYW